MDVEIDAFIDENVVEKVLSRYIAASNRKCFEKSGNMSTIVRLVRELFHVSFNGRNIKAIKELDRLTKNMQVLSLSDQNIASNLEI